MNRNDQKSLVRNLTKEIADEIIRKIDQNRVPENWDGFELREIVADKAREAAYLLKGKKARYKEYKNTVIVNNI